ncbi:MAG: ribosome small subunit-dependent GTPase A, partial [Planctomycetes bacterium]|nr:ribosome small subunit-dependent GTPase A [Planctomycetota bacterium]
MSEDRKQQQRDRYRRQQRHQISYEEQKRRKADKRERGPQRDRHRGDDDEQGFQKMTRRATAPARDAAPPPQPVTPNRAQSEGTVTWLGRGRARVLTDDGEYEATLRAELATAQRSAIAIGDRVVLHEGDDDQRRVVAVLPRRSELARADGEHGRHVLAANIDLVVLVLSAERLRTGLIDRLKIALHDSGARLLVCVNKCDLPHDAAARERELAAHRDGAGSFLIVSATRGDGLDELRAAVAGRSAAFVGHSGVGKSTLLNRLDPERCRDVGAVREADGRGRHTTTASSLVRLADGTELVDTPGVRMFGLVADANWAAAAFPELVALGADCRFRDC